MRTSVDIDDELLREAMAVTGLESKSAVMNEGLRRIVRAARQIRALKELQGLSEWEGDIRELRKDRTLPEW